MYLPLTIPGGHRAHKNSKKPGYGVFIEQFPGGHLQWTHPAGAGGIGQGNGNGTQAFGPATAPIPQPPPLMHGAPGQPVFPQPGGGSQFGGTQNIAPPGHHVGSTAPPSESGIDADGQSETMHQLHQQQAGGGDDLMSNGLGPDALGGHHGPVQTADPLLGTGAAFANWAVQTPPVDAPIVRPWYLYPEGPPITHKKRRKAFVVRRERAEDLAHVQGAGGAYPRVKGIGEFRGGRFY